ncbi:MAG: primosomal protein N' [Tissierellia bacterium]|nr:primosomal protein N' [Tissierellia bacterium]
MIKLLIKYGQVIIDNRASQVDKPFTYIIDKDLIDVVKVGMRVIVPFGQGNKLIKGIVIDILEEFESEYELKKIVDVIDDKPLVTKELIDLSKWIKENYLSTYFDALQLVLPPGDFKEVNTYVEAIGNTSYENLTKDEFRIINYLNSRGRILLADLKKEINLTGINKILNKLEDNGLIETTIEVKTSIEKKLEKWIKISNKGKSLEEILEKINKRATKQIEIIKYLYAVEDISFKELSRKVNATSYSIKSLENKGLVKLYHREVSRNPIKKEIKEYKKHILSSSQRKVYQRIKNSFHGNDNSNKFLIHGVTGSGKTEIYLQLVEEMIELGRDSIILVPEISLTPQTIDRFVGRFGDLVAVLHSKLSYGERFDEWRKIKEGKVKIVIGARSAVFAPFKNLGLIIIDEEHESTYKSSQNPKYHAIEVAKKRADLEKGFLVLGSATPSVDTYYESLKGDIVLLELKERINNLVLPKIKVIDMREELNKGNKSIFSEELYNSLKENLYKERQSILFLNRRGFSTFVSCRNCGYVVKCNNCDISMTYHRNKNKLRCHYCGLAINPPNTCPSCGSKYIKYFGIGTEKVEEFTKELFPEASIVRMDMDTTSRKGSHEAILEDMKNGKIDILIGTQMISKGLDFENVTLVGIIAADTTLNLPDFRSPERGFQLITQVAGRAGRGDNEGKVILQTYDPSHYSIIFSEKHDYMSFYDTEIKLREEFLYPPFVDLISILVYGQDNIKVASVSKEIYNIIKGEISWLDEDQKNRHIIGPYPAPLERINNNFRWQILIKSHKNNINSLKALIKRVCINNEYKLNTVGTKISIDINPNSIL